MSRLVVLFSILMMFTATSILADTHIPATTYTTNTTWSSGGNNYIIDGNVVVSSGVTLTVQAGVKVRFSGYYNIRVVGTIDVQGASNNRCSFSTTNINTKRGEIIVEGLGKFAYCDFDYMGKTDSYWGALAFSGSEDGSVVRHCEFGKNEAYYYGGAIAVEPVGYEDYAYAKICSSTFKANHAVTTGGAINVMGNVVTNIFANEFGSNTVSVQSLGAGGALTSITNTVTGSVYNNLFSYNEAFDGGAVAGDFSSLSFYSNLLHHNTADDEGGAIYFETGDGAGDITAYNNTIADNDANRGGGIYDYSTSTAIKNNIIWGNTATYGPQIWSASGSNFTYSNIQGGFSGTGNINQDPEFLANYHIECGSPSLDTGDPSDALETDYTYVDQGAFHFHQIRGSGDANNDCSITSADPAYLVEYLKGTGPAPYPFWKGDANGECNVNGIDVVFLTSWLNNHVNPPRKNTGCGDARWSVADTCDQCGYY